MTEPAWHSAHELARTALCGGSGCEDVADSDDGLCASCRRRRAAENGRGRADRTVDADAAKPRFRCHTPGCDGEASSLAGRYAYCLACQVARGTRAPNGNAKWAARNDGPDQHLRRRVAGSHTPPGRLEVAALELALAGRRLDRALASFQDAKAEAEDAVRDWRQRVERLPLRVNA